MTNKEYPDKSDTAYDKVVSAIAEGCHPKKIYEMGESHWRSCTCEDKRHATSSDSYFWGTYIG